MRFILISLLAAIIGAPAAPAADATKTPAPAAEAPPTGALKIGYVDLSRLWNEYRRRSDFDNDYKTLRLDLANQDRTRTEEIARYNAQIEKLALGTPERLELEEKAKTAVKEAEEFRRKATEDLNARFVVMLNRLFGDVLREVEAIAKEGNYDLIIKDQTPDPNVNNRTDAIFQLGQRVVLYAKPEYDLTDTVIKRLNDKYAAEQKEKETAPKSPQQPEAPAKEK
jgi:Skp family chaperone for outer membrane proteins